GLAGGQIFGRVEHGEVTADGFALGVTLDALRPAVPALDDAVDVEYEDGVVLHRVDQQAEGVVPQDSPSMEIGRHLSGSVLSKHGTLATPTPSWWRTKTAHPLRVMVLQACTQWATVPP